MRDAFCLAWGYFGGVRLRYGDYGMLARVS